MVELCKKVKNPLSLLRSLHFKMDKTGMSHMPLAFHSHFTRKMSQKLATYSKNLFLSFLLFIISNKSLTSCIVFAVFFLIARSFLVNFHQQIAMESNGFVDYSCFINFDKSQIMKHPLIKKRVFCTFLRLLPIFLTNFHIYHSYGRLLTCRLGNFFFIFKNFKNDGFIQSQK